jgi:predicted DNA-binding transcriptional regulator YafY
MSRRLERLLEIDTLIRANARQTVVSLALAVERSERTVRSDLEFLRDRYHAPLHYTRTKGHHYTEPGWRLPSISLSKGELFALTLGARMLESCAGSSYKEELQSAIARLAERLPEQTWVDLQQLANENVLFRAGAELDLNPEVWQVLESACQLKQRVEMRYYTAGRNDETVRQLDPYVLHFTRNNPYVTGFCHKRQMVRWFRVDRVRSIWLLNERFEVDPTFDRQKHFEDVFQQEVGEKAHEVAIWFDAQTTPFIRERRWHPTQLVEEGQDGTLILRMKVRGLNELKRWILFYGKGAIALGPPELVEMVREEVTQMNCLYEGVSHGSN